MFTKLCAAWVVGLALSPFTAPFRTCDVGIHPGGGANETVSVVAVTATAASLADNAGSLIAPLSTKTGRLRLGPMAGPVLTSFAESAVVFPARQVPSVNRGTRNPLVVTVLRL